MQELDGLIDRNKGYTLKALAKVLGLRETRSLRKELERYGVWGTTVCRQTIYVGEAILLALASHASCDLPEDAGEDHG